jgi:hypothetical protein
MKVDSSFMDEKYLTLNQVWKAKKEIIPLKIIIVKLIKVWTFIET